MVTVMDVRADKMISALKEELKKMKNITPPEWSKYVKSGVNAERIPEQEDFWYIRSAAILRKIYLEGPIGVQRLRNLYGGKKRRGHKPAHHRKAGGKIIRLMLQQLEGEGLIRKHEKKRGRVITPKGQKLLDKIASRAR